MKGLILMQNYFEDTEALATIDILKRAHYDITLVNMSDNEIITTQYNNKIIVPVFYQDIKINEYDFLVIPGGRAVYTSYINDRRVYDMIDYFYQNNKLVACICAAPVLLKKYLKNQKFTCYPDHAKDVDGIYTGKGVLVNDHFVMAKSMYYTTDFALEIVEFLTKNKNVLERSLKAE